MTDERAAGAAVPTVSHGAAVATAVATAPDESAEQSPERAGHGEPAAPAPCAAPGVHEVVLAQLSRLPRGRLLDAPAGRGALSAAAHRLGFEVTACDLHPEQFAAPGLTCDAVDLHGTLPYADGSFDTVVCVEAIEHVENPFHLLRELRRVLRPGGQLIITTPNILSLPSRLRLLATGLSSFFDFDYWLHSSGHITPISAPQLYTAMKACGFSIGLLTGNRVKRGSRLLAPLAALATFYTRRSVKDPALQSILTSPSVLFCEILIVVAE